MATATERADAERHDGTEDDHREGDAGLDERNADAGDAEQAADGHQRHERPGNEPQGAAAELPGEHADHHHGQDVIQPGERVQETVRQTCRVADAGMGGCDRRH